jgi:phytanoyl-CoA hydroxylase
LKTPRGLSVDVPETVAEDRSPRFAANQVDAIREYYDNHGYVIVQGLIASELCRRVRGLWERDVKPFGGYMYRQATARAERHQFNQNGWVMNPILNLQSVDPRHFGEFREFATTSILSADPLVSVLRKLLGEAPKVVQSMYFEGNSATWEHQDSYYLDSEVPGEMAAAWIALEDISAKAGRFFVCPGSHRLRLDDHSLYNNIAQNHETYIQSVVKKIGDLKLEIRAPVLMTGDTLFWNAQTIHGSLDSQDHTCSRSSITCHAIPKSRKFLQLQTRILDVPTVAVNAAHVYRPKDLARTKNRAILFLESRFPSLFYWLKRRAIVFLVRQKAARVGVPQLQ